MDDPEHVFVYGTLRNGSQHPIADRLQKEAVHEGRAFWRGRLYSLGPYPAAVRHAGHLEVRGDLYLLDGTALLAMLDEYEGVDAKTATPDGYVREVDQVRSEDGSRRAAWVYRYTGPVAKEAWIPDGDWLAHLLRARSRP